MSSPSLHSMIWKTKPIIINKTSSSNLILHSSSSDSNLYQYHQQASANRVLSANTSNSQVSPTNSPHKVFASTPTETTVFDFKRSSRSASFTIGDDEHAQNF